MTDSEIIDDSSNIYFIDYLNLPEYAKKQLSNRILRDIFNHMVRPCIQKALKLRREGAEDSPNWKFIEDGELPENQNQVLCYSEHDNEYRIRIYNNGDWFDEYAKSTRNVNNEIEKITQWTFLPEIS